MNWTANENNEHIAYYVLERGNATYTSTNSFSSYINKEEFSKNEGVITEIGAGTYVNVRDDATHGGVPIKVSMTLPDSPVLF